MQVHKPEQNSGGGEFTERWSYWVTKIEVKWWKTMRVYKEKTGEKMAV